jgi:aspartokinase-like uncharacterized kinase
MTAGWTIGTIRGPAAGAGGRRLIAKVGGSLLARSDWPADLAALIAGLPRPLILVIGGGAVVDGLRTLDAACPQPPERMHTLAIDAMRLTARLVADAVRFPLVADPPTSDAVAVLDAPSWLDAHPRWHTELPAGWHVTSDSIAAVIAAALGGDLMLAKSIAPPCGDGDLATLAAAGWVDPHFPIAARAVDAIAWAAPALSLRPH